MPKLVAPLTDAQIKNARPGKASQLTDGQGLYLKLVFPTSGPARHSWRFDFKSPVTGKRNTLIIGTYPAVDLKLARSKAQEARTLIAQGVDPAGQRNEAKAQQDAAALVVVACDGRAAKGFAPAGTLKGVCQDFHELHAGNGNWTELHAAQWLSMMTRKVFDRFPAISAKPIGEVTTDEVLEIIQAIEREKQIPTSRAVRKYLSTVFQYAERKRYSKGDAAHAIKPDTVRKFRGGNNPAVTTPKALAAILELIRQWPTLVTRVALMAQVALFQRPGNTCSMQWAHVDLDAGLWIIPADEMKMDTGEDHAIPLPTQLVTELRMLQKVTGHSQWVFLSPQTTSTGRGPITNDTLTNALRSMGLGGKQTAHGFRATARTMLDEIHDVPMKFIEAQLAHAAGIESNGGIKRDPLGRAYNRATHLDQRAAMIQKWADYLDSLLTFEAIGAASVAVVETPMLEAA